MKNLRFFTFLRTLDEREIQAFHKYLKQMHGGEVIALRVFDYARKLHPDFQDAKKLEFTYAYQRIFEVDISQGSRRKMLDALSDLHLWLKEFLIADKLVRDGLENQALWLDILQERGMQDEYSKQLTRFHQKIKDGSKKDAKQYLMEMATSYSYYQQLASVRPMPDIEALQQCLDSLEACAETIRIRLACQLANAKKMRMPRSIANVSSLIFPQAQIVERSPLLALYCNVYQLVETEQEEYYYQIEAVFKENKLGSDELHGVLNYLHNYAATQIRNGTENNINKRIHELNQLGFEYGLFDQPLNLSPEQFANIISLACLVKDYDWAVSFMEDRQTILPESMRSDIVLLARASITFAKGDFEQVLTLLHSVEFKGTHNLIRSKLLILRSYVELGKENAFEHCLSFEAWLSHRVPKTEAVTGVLASVRVIKMLIGKKEKPETVQNRIDKASNLYIRPWLQKKANDYKPSYTAPQRSK